MSPDRRKTGRLAGVFFLGWVLFNYPVFSLFNRPTVFLENSVALRLRFRRLDLIIGLIMLAARFSRGSSGPVR